MKNREYAVEAVVQEFYGQSMTEDEGFIAPDFFGMAREILNLRAERDALLVINGDLDRDGKLLEAERDALRTRAEVAEVERGQAKMRAAALKTEEAFAHSVSEKAFNEMIALHAERDEWKMRAEKAEVERNKGEAS
jgi:hypothetical protein